MTDGVLTAVRSLLAARGVPFEEIEHEEVRTARQAAAARGMALEQGAKSLLLKVDDRFAVFVLGGGSELRSRLLRRHLGAHRTRFADRDELLALTGVEPGAMPPFGRPIFDLPLYADTRLAEQERIGFTAGSRTRSFVVATRDWLDVARPDVFRFAGEGSFE